MLNLAPLACLGVGVKWGARWKEGVCPLVVLRVPGLCGQIFPSHWPVGRALCRIGGK